jgi:transcriptional regulator with XRE-family HTH domain
MNEKDIYSKLRALRRARGITVNKLAEKMGEDHQKVGRIERGRRSVTVEYLMKVSKALETPVEDLLKNVQVKEANSGIENDKSKELLSQIVVYVERCFSQLPPEQKGAFISKIYQLTLNFPKEYQEDFIKSFFDGLEILQINDR